VFVLEFVHPRTTAHYPRKITAYTSTENTGYVHEKTVRITASAL